MILFACHREIGGRFLVIGIDHEHFHALAGRYAGKVGCRGAAT